MKKIVIFSSNRADLAFIYILFKLFNESKKYRTLAVINDSSKVDSKYLRKDKIVKINLKKVDTRKYNLINHLGKLLKKYTRLLSKVKPEYILIVGDRYEAFAMSIVCNFLNIKIIHIAGGDVTEGAYDEEMRSYISKSAYLHFVTNIKSKQNLLYFVKDKSKIFNYGSPSLDYIKRIKKIDKKEISKKLNITFNKFNILITFHPETKYLKSTLTNLKVLLNSLETLGNSYNFFITGSNVDTFGQIFNRTIKNLASLKKNFYFFSNLGTINYIQLANNCDMVIGNSSSIVYEIPFMGVKSLLIGSRQEGRYMSKKIVKIRVDKKEIVNMIKKNISKKKPKKDLKTFGNGFSSNKIFNKINSLINEK
tara:strand:+ start:3864 stop:4958 length:1095 start_codon:yes stop_codon:yes gene_type:complete